VFLFVVASVYACSPACNSTHSRCPLPYRGALSRRGGAADSVIQALNSAQKTIHVAMYGLTHPGIVDALLAAKNRGVDVALKTNKIESAGKTQAVVITKLQAAGLPVEVSEQSRLLHHKFAVIDSVT
jgi:phosphatidylserine/phosphatidylglycerophosphate/cardiolipin synthase-like enzyme